MKRIYHKLVSVLLIGGLTGFGACDYLDVVPDNIATIDNAFTSRTTAEKYLFTCYSYLPSHAGLDNALFLVADEFWLPYPQAPAFFNSTVFEGLAMGNQSVVSPMLNYWDGKNGGKPMFQALRDCNAFLENIDRVPGMIETEKKRWIAEVKFLKAYYHFWLVQMYGPIPLIRQNLPISAGVEEVQVQRESVDDCFAYIVELLDEAIPDLPPKIQSESSELGRITRVIAASVKARILVEAASPLYNGNMKYASFRNVDGHDFFNQQYEVEKWEQAVEACRVAIHLCDSLGLKLYEYKPLLSTVELQPSTLTQMSIRNSISDRWNPEVIWGNSNSQGGYIQNLSQAFIDPSRLNNLGVRSILAPTLKIAEMFYTKNGVPIEEDETYDYVNRYKIKEVTNEYRYNLIAGYETVGLHFDREDRFYADLGFDGGIWYGQGRYDDGDAWPIKARFQQFAGKRQISLHSVTGYFTKKLVNYENIIESGDGGPYTVNVYPWPVMRLADLYLLYAEALNEVSGPVDLAFTYIDKVRNRAGLKGVKDSWSAYARDKGKYTNQGGFREIIQRERLIELALEGQRFCDIRRWNLAKEMFNNETIQGWDVDQKEAPNYYRVKTLFTRKYGQRDNFWPISEGALIVNKNLRQNYEW